VKELFDLEVVCAHFFKTTIIQAKANVGKSGALGQFKENLKNKKKAIVWLMGWVCHIKRYAIDH
jgi:hypothetical protein